MFIINESALSTNPAIHKKHEHSIEFITILQEAEKQNRNGRVYHKSVLEQGLNSPYIQERIRTNSWFGEAGHPSDSSVQRQMTVDLRNIAFIIKEFWWEGNLLKARCETANTAVGRDMMGLIEQGVKVAFSLRAQGNVHQDPVSGKTIVESPIQIVCYDWVGVPSHDSAFLQSVCEETRSAMLYGNRFPNKQVALIESANIFENGELISMDEKPEIITEDYTTKYTTALKKRSDIYLPEAGDIVKSMNLTETIVNNDRTHKIKKVLTEDYLVKDIRASLLNLGSDE